MKPEFRRDLARSPFQEKIRKVAELIRLSRKVKDQRTAGNLTTIRFPVEVYAQRRAIRNRLEIRKFVAEQRISKEQGLQAGLGQKGKEFVEQGA